MRSAVACGHDFSLEVLLMGFFFLAKTLEVFSALGNNNKRGIRVASRGGATMLV